MRAQKILVIEDSPTWQLILERNLSKIAEVEITDNIIEAQFILGHAPDHYCCVVLDWELEAGFTGNMIEGFLERHHIPAVYFTGHESVTSEHFPVIVKSSKIGELMQMVTGLIEHKKVYAH